MKIGRQVAIFNNIESDKFTDEEKALAIYDVMNMPTHNGVTKATAFKVIRYLWDRAYEIDNEDCESDET